MKDGIRIKELTKNRLDSTIAQLKKRKRGRVTYDDAIQSLFKKIKDLKAEIRTLQAKAVLADATQKEADTLTERADTTKQKTDQTITEASEHTKCPHYSWGENVVLCSKDYDKKGVIHKVPETVCIMCWQRNKDILAPQTNPDTEKVECLCRYKHAGEYFCVKNPPRTVKLAHGLKTCLACPDRLTKEKAEQRGLILRTHNYVTCGAKEHMDPKVGLMLYCEREGGKWVTIAHCKKKKCEHLKTVQTT